MKINFKHLLIIFLVALLGGGIGSLGINTILNGTDTFGEDKPLVVNQLNYDNKYNNDYSSAINKAYETVVEINSTKSSTSFYFGRSESTSAGSGVIISDDGYIVTNHHVIKDADKVTVKLNSGETFEAKLIGGDSRSDLALIKIDVNNLHYSNFVNSDELQMGDPVIAIGNPLGEGITASTGIISSLEKELYINDVYMDLIQTDASINEGNSGGGLFDMQGNIVGIVNAKSTSGYNASVEGMGYAIPANRVIKIISDIKEYGFVKDRPTLGVKVGNYSYNSYYYQNNNGLLITDVIDGGGAKKAGLEVNDLIIEVDDTKITSYAILNKILESHEIGDTIKVVVQRNNQQLTFEVTLTEAMN